MSRPQITEELKQWATPSQAIYIDAILAANGNLRKAARALGKHHSTLQESMTTLLTRAASRGYSPEHELYRTVPDPFLVKGHSMLDRVDPETGARTKILEWTKTRVDDAVWLENVKAGITAFMADQPPIAEPTLPPKSRDFDIIPFIQIGDGHLGMMAHEAETGANFDLKIAKRELLGGIFRLIDESEPTERIFINDVGDFTHYENMKGETEASGHRLDFDGRFPKMIDMYAEIMRAIVDKALSKAAYVDIAVNMGNHSRTNDIWMAVLLKHVYGRTGRVNVLNNRSPFIGYRMGNTFVMTHHSDKCKPARLGHVMSTDFAADWGETRYRYCDIGHIHHNMVLKEHPGLVIESWNQLANKDQWAHDNGYRARQAISMVERSRTYGEQRRRMLSIDQIRDSIEAAALKAGQPVPYRPPVMRAYAV